MIYPKHWVGKGQITVLRKERYKMKKTWSAEEGAVSQGRRRRTCHKHIVMLKFGAKIMVKSNKKCGNPLRASDLVTWLSQFRIPDVLPPERHVFHLCFPLIRDTGALWDDKALDTGHGKGSTGCKCIAHWHMMKPCPVPGLSQSWATLLPSGDIWRKIHFTIISGRQWHIRDLVWGWCKLSST